MGTEDWTAPWWALRVSDKDRKNGVKDTYVRGT